MRPLYIFPTFLMFYEFTIYMSNDMYTPAFPMIANDFAVNEGIVQLTLSSWLFGGVIAQGILGPLSDRYGRRPILFGGGLLFLLSCLVCINTSSMLIFIISRFFQGIGVCSMMIAGYACIHDIYQDREAVNILSLMSGVSVTAPMIGPLIGGYLITLYDWRMIFYIIFVMALFSLISLYFVMPKDKVEAKIKLNIKNIVTEYFCLIRNKQFISYSITFGALYSGIILWIATSPFLLMKNQGLDSKQFGMLQIPIFGAFMVGSQIVRYVSDKFPLERFIKIGLAGAILSGCILLICAIYAESSTSWLIWAMTIYALSFGISTAPLNRLSFNSSDSNKGITASMFYTCMMGTGSLITIIFGLIYNERILSYAIMMSVVIILAVLFFIRARVSTERVVSLGIDS